MRHAIVGPRISPQHATDAMMTKGSVRPGPPVGRIELKVVTLEGDFWPERKQHRSADHWRGSQCALTRSALRSQRADTTGNNDADACFVARAMLENCAGVNPISDERRRRRLACADPQ
jgi:hypothetical protein